MMGCVSVRLGDGEHQRLRLRAAELGLSMGEYARRAVLAVLDGAGEGVAVEGPAVAAPSRPDRPAHQHRAVVNGPIARCRCGAIRVDGVWRVP